MTKSLAFLSLMFATFNAVPPAFGCSSLVGQPLTVSYDPTSPTATTAQLTLTIIHDPNDFPIPANTFTFNFLKKTPGSEAENIEYSASYVSSSPNASHVLDATTSNASYSGLIGLPNFEIVQTLNALDGYFGTPGSADLTVQLEFPPGQSIPNGTHTISYLMQGWLGFGSDVGCPYENGWKNEVLGSFNLVVPGAFQMNLKGGGVGGTMDFGSSMATNDQQTVTLTLNATNPFQVALQSNHDGMMKLNDDPASTDELAYSATLNGTAISEASPYNDATLNGTNGADTDLDFTVTVTGDTTTKRAGLYKDTITLTVQAIP